MASNGALGSNSLGSAPLGGVGGAVDERYVLDGYWEYGYAVGDVQTSINASVDISLAVIPVVVSAPQATANTGTIVNVLAATIAVTSPQVNVSGSASISIVDLPQVTVSAPLATESVSAITNVQAVSIALTPSEASAVGGAEATFADSIEVGVQAPTSTETGQASASASLVTITISAPTATAASLAVAQATIPEVTISQPEPTSVGAGVASPSGINISVISPNVTAQNQAIVSVEAVTLSVVSPQAVAFVSIQVSVSDLANQQIAITAPDTGFGFASIPAPQVEVNAPVVTVEAGSVIGESSSYQAVTRISYTDEITLLLPATVESGGTLWKNQDNYWINWEKRRVFILSSVGTGTLVNINGDTRTTFPLHVLRINEDGTTTLLDTYPSNLSTSISSPYDGFQGFTLPTFVVFSDDYRDGWTIYYYAVYTVDTGARYVFNSVDYSESEGFRHNGVNLTDGTTTGLGDPFGASFTGNSGLYYAGPTGANWFLFRYRLPAGFTQRYRLIKCYKDLQNETLASADFLTTINAITSQVLATYDQSTIVAYADPLSYQNLNAFEAGFDVGRFRQIDSFNRVSVLDSPVITVSAPQTEFPAEASAEVSTVFVSAPVASATGVTNIEGITVSVVTPDVQAVVTVEANSEIFTVLVTAPQTTFGVDYEANIDLPTVTVQTPTVYPSIVDFPDLPTIGIVRPQATATGTTNANSLGVIVAITTPQVEATSRSTINVEVTTIPCTAPSVVATGEINVVGLEIVTSTPEATAAGTANGSSAGFDIAVSAPEALADVSYNAFATGVNIEVNSADATVISTANISSAGFIIQITLPGVEALVNYRSPERTIIVPIEDRQIEVAFERRTIKVEFEDRVIEVT